MDHPFGQYEEEAVISLILDHPDRANGLIEYLEPEIFKGLHSKFIIANIMEVYRKHSVIPTKGLIKDLIMKQLTVEDDFEPILEILDRECNHRDIALITESLGKWAKHKTFSMLYDQESIDAYQSGDYTKLEEVFNRATRVNSTGAQGLWLFKQLDELFIESNMIHIPTGFPSLDRYLNEGGPSPGEVLIWAAPTGVGKSILLCNNSIQGVKDNRNVLHVTFELSAFKTAKRMIGALTGIQLREFKKKYDDVKKSVNIRMEGKTGNVVIYELPPGECSVNHIYAIIDNLKKTKNWKPDIVVLDYLELMTSREQMKKQDEYAIQKKVSTEIRGLARNENVLIYTATQTNRSSNNQTENEPNNIDLSKLAESYGKAMAADYIISMNQNEAERNMNPARCRLYIAKNRNGEKFVSVETMINYNTMEIKEKL